MSKCDTAQRNLCKSLGKEYRICTIDLERVIYRDFGNGFNVEISGTRTASKRKLATIYLWFGESFIVKSVQRVTRDDISATVEELYAYTKELISRGYNTRDALFQLKHPELYPNDN